MRERKAREIRLTRGRSPVVHPARFQLTETPSNVMIRLGCDRGEREQIVRPKHTEIVMTQRTAWGLARTLAGTWLLGVALLGAQQARAQAGPNQYEILPVPERLRDGSPEEDKRLKTELDRQAISVLRGDASLNDEQIRSRFDGYFTQYYFAILTHPKHLSRWPERRLEFLDRRLGQARSQAAHQHLLNLTIRMMAGIVRGNFHPAARYNAMLLIGGLNSTEASTVGERRPPVPLNNALRFMLDELQDPEQLDAVRVAALNGILRHARVDRQLPRENRRLVGNNAEKMIVDAMLAIIGQGEPPEGRSEEGHDWLRQRAIDVLAMLGSGQSRVVAALQEIVRDEEARVVLRCAAAEALGRLVYPEDANINVAQLARQLGAVAATACYREIERVERQLEREGTPKPPPHAPRRPLGAGAFGKPTVTAHQERGPMAYRIDLTRRRLKHQLQQVRSGLAGTGTNGTGGLATLVEDEELTERLQSYVKAIDAVIAETDKSDHLDQWALVTVLRPQAGNLEEVFGVTVEQEEPLDEMDLLTQPLEEGLPELPMQPMPDAEPPFDEPEMPADEPEVPADEPDFPLDEPEMPADQPELPFDDPDLPMDELDIPDQEPDLPLDLPVDEPDFDVP